jgi:hypothetical protein
VVKEVETNIQENGAGQTFIYTKSLELPRGWHKGTRLNIKTVGDKLVVTKKN